MKISRPKRTSTENASSSEAREAVNIVGNSVNSFMNEVYIAVMGNLGVSDNLNMTFKTITVNVDASGYLNRSVTFKGDLKTRSQGIMVIRAFGSIPTAQPFISYSEDSGLIKIVNISGLVADTDYQLNILIIGS